MTVLASHGAPARRVGFLASVGVGAVLSLTSCAEPDLVTPDAATTASAAPATSAPARATVTTTTTATQAVTAAPRGSVAATGSAASSQKTELPAIPTSNSAVVTSGVQFSTSDQKIDLSGETTALCLLAKDSLDASFTQAGTTVKVSASTPGNGSVVVTGKHEFLGAVTALTTNPASGAFTVSGAGDDQAVTFSLKGSCPKK